MGIPDVGIGDTVRRLRNGLGRAALWIARCLPTVAGAGRTSGPGEGSRQSLPAPVDRSRQPVPSPADGSRRSLPARDGGARRSLPAPADEGQPPLPAPADGIEDEHPPTTPEGPPPGPPATIDDPAVFHVPATIDDPAVFHHPATIDDPAGFHRPGSIDDPAAFRPSPESPAATEGPTGNDGRGTDPPALPAADPSTGADDPFGRLPPRDRPLCLPADGAANDTYTTALVGPDGELRVEADANPRAFVRSDVRVLLDHLR